MPTRAATSSPRPGGGNRVGERLAAAAADAAQRPGGARAEAAPFQAVGASSGSASVFDNGMATPAVDWIVRGRADQPGAAARLGAEDDAPATAAVDNLILEDATATATLDEMLAATERGLLLTTLWYIREVDPQTLLLTGLTRDGVFLVEGGEVTGAVNNFRFNESPVDLLGAGGPGEHAPSAPSRASGTTGSPGRPCPPCGCPTST